jgi:pyrimidine-nucleoside phosphorylase
LDVKKITNKKLSGGFLTDKELEFVVKSYIDNTINDNTMANFLRSVHQKGMSKDETVTLTRIMIESGETINFQNLNSYVGDKHSTGGVGDKVSIILGPILAALGIAVPMLAGRSLGHTGGTIDKLETIPGFKTDLSVKNFKKNVERTGICIMSQTDTICPADKKIYALRDVTGTIDSIPLICGSIMSKKISEGINGLVLDIKIGNGAFMPTLEEGKKLGSLLKYIGKKFGVSTKLVYSNMNQPLGKTAGMWCEIDESIKALQGEGAKDLMRVVFELGSRLIVDAGLIDTHLEAVHMQQRSISNGKAFKKFEEMVFNQNGQIKKRDYLNKPLY